MLAPELVAVARDTRGRADTLAALLAAWALVDDDLHGLAALAERIYADLGRIVTELESGVSP